MNMFAPFTLLFSFNWEEITATENSFSELDRKLVNSSANLKLVSDHHVSSICCSVIKISLRKRSDLTMFIVTRFVTARLIIKVKHTVTYLLEVQST